MTRRANPQAVRDLDAAYISLGHAEQLANLFDMLGNDTLTSNPYIADAAKRAHLLVAEMAANLDATMDRWSPEECGIDA